METPKQLQALGIPPYGQKSPIILAMFHPKLVIYRHHHTIKVFRKHKY